MNFVAVISFTVFIAGIIGLIRSRQIDPAYRPIIYLVWIGCINEVISYLLIRKGHSNAVTGNIYVLLEALLVIYQFRKWRLFEKRKSIYSILIAGIILFWLAENFIFRSIKVFASYFIIAHAFVIVLLTITLLNQLMAREKKNLTRSPIFIICICFIIYFSNAALVEIYYLYGLSSSNEFQIYVTRILVFVNLFTNLLLALAVLWMPKKRGFSF